ncbi:MAG: DnaB-like helicase C-terminal domain-containing protein [Candidatus Thiodiazotropha taylori]
MDNILEMRIIGGMLIDSMYVSSVNIRPCDFQFKSLGEIHGAMLEMQSQNDVIDLVTVAQYLEKKTNKNYLELLQDAYQAAQIGASNTEALAEAVKERALARKAKEVGLALAHDMDVNKAIKSLLDMGAESRRYSYSLTEATKKFYEEVSSNQKGITSGLSGLDRILGGFRNGDLYVIGARPAMGKTALMLNLSLAANEAVGVISSEQGSNQIASRNIAILSDVNAWALRNNLLVDHEWARLKKATNKINNMPYYIYDKAAPSILDVVRKAREWKYKYQIQILYVDYIQRLKATDRSLKKHEQMEEVVQGLKELARDLNIPVIALAQVKREVDYRKCKRPGMADLKDSGSIEQEADCVIMLYRDEVYDSNTKTPGVAELNIEKNRHGPNGYIRTAWIAESMRFEDVGEGVN